MGNLRARESRDSNEGGEIVGREYVRVNLEGKTLVT